MKLLLVCARASALLAAAIVVTLLATGCTLYNRVVAPRPHYIDLVFRIAKTGAPTTYPHTVDASGTLWYIDGSRVVAQRGPGQRRVIADADARSGNIFWYDRAVYVLNGDGRTLTKMDDRLHPDPVVVPSAYAPVEGIVADARHRGIVAAQSSAHELAVIDGWKWYGERLPSKIAAFSATLAGGPHGKKYLVVGDQRAPLVAVKNRWTGQSRLVRVPENTCFSKTEASLRIPVDVRGRDYYRTWVTSGEHVVSIDLRSKRILRVWDVDGCAMQIVSAGRNAALVMLSAPSEQKGYVSSLVRVDREGVHALPQYGRIESLGPGGMMDRYARLWWFDTGKNAFICRTPLS